MTELLNEVTDVCTSNDEEDKAQTLSITLRQGDRPQLSWHYNRSRDGVRGRAWSSIHPPPPPLTAAAVPNSINKKPPASECLSVSLKVLDYHVLSIISPVLVKEARENCFIPWCFCGIEPRRYSMKYKLHTNKAASTRGNEFNNMLLLAASPFTMNGFT